MPATIKRYGVRDPFDPHQNLTASARMIRDLLVHYKGNVLLTGAIYNAGEGVIRRPWNDWPMETRNYLNKIIKIYPQLTKGRWRLRLPKYIPAVNSMR
jgi:soluble lytic murein transglycosylase-like protein